MFITVDSNNINLMPENYVEEIIQNIKVIVTTVIGNVPLDRKFGINGNVIDAAQPKGKSMLTINILESVQDYEPRVEISGIEFIEDVKGAEKGILIPKLEVKIKDEYIT